MQSAGWPGRAFKALFQVPRGPLSPLGPALGILDSSRLLPWLPGHWSVQAWSYVQTWSRASVVMAPLRCQMVSCTELAQLSRSWPSRGSGLVCICRHKNLFVFLGMDWGLYLQDVPKLEAGRTRGFWGMGEDITATHSRQARLPSVSCLNTQNSCVPSRSGGSDIAV